MKLTKAATEAFLKRAGYDPEKGRATMDSIRGNVSSLRRAMKKAELNFEPVDEMHLNTLAMAMEVQLRAAADIFQNGVMVYIDKSKKVKQKNHSVSTFYQMSKLINDTSKKIGFSALDRKDLNIESQIEDEFKD